MVVQDLLIVHAAEESFERFNGDRIEDLLRGSVRFVIDEMLRLTKILGGQENHHVRRILMRHVDGFGEQSRSTEDDEMLIPLDVFEMGPFQTIQYLRVAIRQGDVAGDERLRQRARDIDLLIIVRGALLDEITEPMG